MIDVQPYIDKLELLKEYIDFCIKWPSYIRNIMPFYFGKKHCRVTSFNDFVSANNL